MAKADVFPTYQECLEAHYLRNDHHPEHFLSISQMSIECRMELTCDLLGCVMGWARKENKNLNVAECRAFIEKHHWRHWIHAVTDKLPPASEVVPELKPRWYNKKYPVKELNLLKTGTEELECIRDYIDDTIKHKSGVFKAWQEIVKMDPRFEMISERIQNHDLDKFRPDMIQGYTIQYSTFEC